MTVKKKVQEYQSKYGDIPVDIDHQVKTVLENGKFKDKDLELMRGLLPLLQRPKWHKFKYTIYLIPQATPRPRAAFGGRCFYVKDAADNSRMFKDFMDSLLIDIRPNVITTQCKLYINAYFPTPAGMNKVEKLFAELRLVKPVSKPDFDNLAKTYADMMQKHLLLDDSLIHTHVMRKLYSIKPRIEIEIDFMDSYDCKFNKKKIESWTNYDEDKYIERQSII